MDRDYISPGLRVVVPDAHFPRMRVGDRASHPWKYLRQEVPHYWYADERFPLMGFMNRDEALILHNLALQFAGKAALEIGGWLGWSTCHLALAGVRVDVVDPAYLDNDFRAIAERSLAGCGVSANVQLLARPSPEGVCDLVASGRKSWSLFVIDGDHEAPAPERDVAVCLPYAAPDCAFVFHDLASPAVAAGLRLLQREGFNVLVYQTQQIMGLAWRGNVTPVAHIPDPEVAWQLPHHLVGLPVSGVDFDALELPRPSASVPNTDIAAVSANSNSQRNGDVRLLRDLYPHAAGDWRPSVCIVSNEIIGPFKNGGIGTSMTGLAEHLADSGCDVTILYTGGVWNPDIHLGKWKKRYAQLGIEFVSISLDEMKSTEGPVKNCGFGIPYLVYKHLVAKHFHVIHFNDCTGEGSLCLVAKKMGLAFQDTLLVLALHSPSQWVLELNHTIPASLLLTAYNHAERLSVKCADVVWSPSKYLIDWARSRGFELPQQSFVQQYCLPSQRLRESSEGPADFPAVNYGRTAPPKEIVFFGRLEERKGLRLFCNAINALRQELNDRGIAVTFLGKAEMCGDQRSLDYIAQVSADWEFEVNTVTNLGQPEALAYLLSGDKLAVIASPVDNSPCTVYEAQAWGIPFLAPRTGGVAELIREDHRDHVLFDCNTDSLCNSLRAALDNGGWIAAPAQSQVEGRRVWTAFHADSKRYLQSSPAEGRVRPVVAIVEGQSVTEIEVTLESLAASGVVQHVVVLNRSGKQPSLAMPGFSIRNIDLTFERAGKIDEEIENLHDESVLLIHAGIRLRADAFTDMLAALDGSGVDGLQPAGAVVGEGVQRTVLPLGGDPSFTLFEGSTFTGGLLVRAEAFKLARRWRELVPESPFMGLADFCVTRGIEIWPYPEQVFERSQAWTMNAVRPLPLRMMAFDESTPADRYYMLAMGYGARTNIHSGKPKLTALTLIDLGLLPVVRLASWIRRRRRTSRRRLPFGGPIERYLQRLLRGNG